jgi:predicted  nucleic acid-binding Zn-ribbon protein
VTTELDLARSVLQQEEADWIRLADTIAGLEVQARDADRRLEQVRETQAEARRVLNEELAAAETARNAARAERERAAQQIERALRTRYERLRAARRTKVVVALAGAACGACYTTVPLNRRAQIQAGVLIDSCESCGVILYSDDARD